MGVIAPETGRVYYSGLYWNDFPIARAEINRRATGDPSLGWYDHFFRSQKRKFKKVLMLNCGNGWVEREMYGKGYITELVGVDFSEDLLSHARREAHDLPLRYYKMDINSAGFPEDGFDLVINHAAGHHIANINKVFCELLRVMTKDGVFLNYDYIGPHRNQYPIEQWHAAHVLNLTLPANVRQIMSYPHLPTMLVTDPSEAVHSELIMPVMRRYFDLEFFEPVGGALAYILLTHNQAIQKASKRDVNKAVTAIMSADDAYHAAHPAHSMFAYWTGRPRASVLRSTKKLAAYQQEEDAREERAARQGGEYYPHNLIQDLYLELDELRIAKQHKEATIGELQQENDRLRGQLQDHQHIMRTASRRTTDMLRRAKRRLGTSISLKAD